MQIVTAQARGRAGHDKWPADALGSVSTHGQMRPEVLAGGGACGGKWVSPLGEHSDRSALSGSHGHAARGDHGSKKFGHHAVANYRH